MLLKPNDCGTYLNSIRPKALPIDSLGNGYFNIISSSKSVNTSGSMLRRNSFKFTLQSLPRFDGIILAVGCIVTSAAVSATVSFAVFGS